MYSKLPKAGVSFETGTGGRSQVRTIEPLGLGEVWTLLGQLCRMQRSHFKAGILRHQRRIGVRKLQLL